MDAGLMAALLARRSAVIERHLILESVPGSAWHAGSADSKRRAEDGEAILSARPVALQADDEVYLVGDCAASAHEAATAWAASLPDGAADEPYQAGAIAAARGARLLECAGTPYLAMNTRKWNAFNIALGERGVRCCLTTLKG